MKAMRRVAALLLTLALLITALTALAAEPEVRALFINVGKADAALYLLGDKRFLVDTGTKDSYDQLERALDALDVSRLDGVLVTHTDKDHAGGLKKLLKSDIQVDALYAGALHSEKSTEDHPVYKAAKKHEMAVTWLAAGDVVDLGNGCAFHVLGPLTRDAEKENNNSLVLRLVTPQGDMLLTGDMELEEEAELLAQGLISQAEVLKVAHHGEDDATGRAFVLLARPQWAVISTSTAEEPDTPDPKILARLWEVNASVAVTQEAELGVLITLEDGRAGSARLHSAGVGGRHRPSPAPRQGGFAFSVLARRGTRWGQRAPTPAPTLFRKE